jgi:AAA family ATP:ADP antiporter
VARSEPEFTGWRRYLWPIHPGELARILPMLLMFFFVSLVYSLLRNTKDTLIVTAPGGGAGVIPFLKVYGVIPGALLFMLGYIRLSSRLGRRALFNLCIAGFIGFFALFALVFPFRESIEPAQLAGRLLALLPPGFASPVAVIRHWVLSLFYVMAELWGSVALSLLFWGFANEITTVEQSRRWYALFGIGANLALVAVKGVNHLLHWAAGAAPGLGDPWTAYVALLMAFVILCALAVIGLHQRLCAQVLAAAPVRQGGQPLPGLGLLASLRFLMASSYLRNLAGLVIAYGIAINLIEVTWKSQLARRYPDPLQYQDFMADFASATGLVTLFLMLFVASNLLRRIGWTGTALVTPVVLGVTGLGFFAFILAGTRLAAATAAFGTRPLAVAVLFGTLQNVLSKASKYALFDPTKEMAYIPLDRASRIQGKAAIDVAGARFGKAGGALLQQLLIAWHGSLQAATGTIAMLFFAVIGLWIVCAARLGRAFSRLTRN